MAKPIIAALRQRTDLKESLLHTAQELAHRASIYGVVDVSYSYLAEKCHCSRRTVLRHIQRLLDLGIIKRTRLWIRANYCAINKYSFLIAWETSRSAGGSDKTASKFPHPEREKNSSWGEEREKSQSLHQQLANQQKAVREGWVPPGSERWEAVREEIARLEQLLAPGALPALA
jgi:DNA-binding Lrp family transcriptional regulator